MKRFIARVGFILDMANGEGVGDNTRLCTKRRKVPRKRGGTSLKRVKCSTFNRLLRWSANGCTIEDSALAREDE